MWDGVVNQIAAIEEGDDLNSRRQDVIVEFFHFFVNAFKGRLRRCAFAQQHDA